MPNEVFIGAGAFVLAALLVLVWFHQIPWRTFRAASSSPEGVLQHPSFPDEIRADVLELVRVNKQIAEAVAGQEPLATDDAERRSRSLRDAEASHSRLQERLKSAGPPFSAILRGDTRDYWKRWSWVRAEIARGRKLLTKAERSLRTSRLAAADPATSVTALKAKLRWPYEVIALTVDDNHATVEIAAPRNRVSRTTTAKRGSGRNRRTVTVDRPERDINAEYAIYVANHARSALDITLSTVPGLSGATLSVFTSRVHPLRGHDYLACILSVVVNRTTWDSILQARVDGESALKNFDLRFRRDRTNRLVDITPFTRTEPMPADALDLDPAAFERYVTLLLHKMGLSAVTTGRSGDGGIDIEAHDEDPIRGGTIIVQCKRYAGSVGAPVVRDLLGAVTRARAMKGILITTGWFTREAERFAEESPITLIGGVQLQELLLRHDLLATAAASPVIERKESVRRK